MNLSQDKISEIQRLRNAGKSQNEIAEITGVSKPYVNTICKQVDYSPSVVSGLGFINQAIPEEKRHNWSFPENNNQAELRYKDQRIADLEMQLKDFKNDFNKLSQDHAILQKEHAVLQIEHKSIEAKHQYEKDNIVAQNQFNQKSSLDGLIDKVATPLLNNQKLVDAISLGIMHKLAGGAAPVQQIQTSTGYDHPLKEHQTAGGQVTEILEVLKQFNADEIEKLHTLFGVFIMERAMLPSVVNSAVDYMQKKQNTNN